MPEGATENRGLEKCWTTMQGWKMRDWKCWTKIRRLENAE